MGAGKIWGAPGVNSWTSDIYTLYKRSTVYGKE